MGGQIEEIKEWIESAIGVSQEFRNFTAHIIGIE
jgi:hypothetical protein